MLDEIKANANLLVSIPEAKFYIETIQVKYIECDPDLIQDLTNVEAKTATFRVYQDTKFEDIKKAACLYYKKIDQSFTLTDEYFNNLSAVAISI